MWYIGIFVNRYLWAFGRERDVHREISVYISKYRKMFPNSNIVFYKKVLPVLHITSA